MKKVLFYIISVLLLFSCTEQESPDGYGFLQVSSFGIETQAEVQPLKRSVDSRLQVDICQGATVIKTFPAGAPELNSPITLPVGSYTLRAHTPDMEEAAGNETGNPTYSVSTDFNITEGTTTAIEPLAARQVNIGVLLQYPEAPFGTAFTNVTCTLASPSGRSVTTEGTGNTALTYFNLPENGQLQYTLKVVNTDDETYTLGPKTLPVEAGKNYCVQIDWD